MGPESNLAGLARLLLSIVLLSASSVLPACGVEVHMPDGSYSDDTGVVRDARVPTDGHVARDAGVLGDASASLPDAATHADAGVLRDAGVASDGGHVSPADAGEPAPEPPPRILALFSVPTRGSGDTRIEDATMQDEVLRLIDMAAPGSSVRVAMYSWSRLGVVTRLVTAFRERGVDVHVVIDGGGVDEEVLRALYDGLGAGRIHRCSHGGSCIGDRINHNKFFLFSALSDGSRNVVVQSSANLNAGQVRKHNNLVIVRGDVALYEFYLSYWQDLRGGVQNFDYYRVRRGDRDTKAYFFPRASGDTVLSVLRNVHCGTLVRGVRRPRIRIAMGFFTDGRRDVPEMLVSMRDRGCDVQVIIGSHGSSSPGDHVLRVLRAGSVAVTVAANPVNVHSKYLLIDAVYGDSRAERRLVFTGSHNFTQPALRRNDEAMLRIEDPSVFEAFWVNWTTIRAQF